MKFVAIFAILVSFACAAPPPGRGGGNGEENDLPDQANPNAKRLGHVKLSEGAEVEFVDVDDSIVLSASIPQDQEDVIQRMIDAEKEAGGDPVLMYDLLAGGSDKVPSGLVTKWQNVKKARKQQAPTMPTTPSGPAPPVTAEDAEDLLGNRRNLRGLSFTVLTGDWWADNYCSEFRLESSGCECYKWLTGDYYDWIYGTELKMHLYPYYAPTGGVRHAVKKWECGSSCNWNLLWAGYIVEGNIGWATAWGPTGYYGAFAEWANTDRYYWSMYEIDPSICNPPPGVWQSCAGVETICPNRNFSV